MKKTFVVLGSAVVAAGLSFGAVQIAGASHPNGTPAPVAAAAVPVTTTAPAATASAPPPVPVPVPTPVTNPQTVAPVAAPVPAAAVQPPAAVTTAPVAPVTPGTTVAGGVVPAQPTVTIPLATGHIERTAATTITSTNTAGPTEAEAQNHAGTVCSVTGPTWTVTGLGCSTAYVEYGTTLAYTVTVTGAFVRAAPRA